MKPITGSAQRIFDRIITRAEAAENRCLKIHDNESFMALHVEHLESLKQGELWSFAHYGKQNGDAMRDPDMVFIVKQGLAYPVSYQNDYMNTYQEAIVFDGAETLIRPQLYSSMRSFASQWMKNLREQQNI